MLSACRPPCFKIPRSSFGTLVVLGLTASGSGVSQPGLESEGTVAGHDPTASGSGVSQAQLGL